MKNNTSTLLNKYTTLLHKCLYNRVYQIEDKKASKQMLCVINDIKNVLIKLFKNMYKYEYMLALLAKNNYTSKDAEILDYINTQLIKICDELIQYMLVAIRYRTLLMVTYAYKYINFKGDVPRNIYKQIINNLNKKHTSIEIYDFLSNYIIMHPEYTGVYTNAPITDFDTFFMDIVSRVWTANDWNIINNFAKKYENKYDYSSFTLQEKLCDINELKHHSHHFGTLLNDTRDHDRYYFFHTMSQDEIDKITKINEKVVEKELMKLVGY